MRHEMLYNSRIKIFETETNVWKKFIMFNVVEDSIFMQVVCLSLEKTLEEANRDFFGNFSTVISRRIVRKNSKSTRFPKPRYIQNK
jgi:hypothetical protein